MCWLVEWSRNINRSDQCLKLKCKQFTIQNAFETDKVLDKLLDKSLG